MRKPSSAMILSVLFVFSWLGFFASKPRAASNAPGLEWVYDHVKSESDLAARGKEGWEAYAVGRLGGDIPTYYLKKPVALPAADRFVDPAPSQ